MPANDPALRRALGKQAIETRWGNREAANAAARDARTLMLEQQIRRAVTDPPGLSDEQRLHLADLLTAGA